MVNFKILPCLIYFKERNNESEREYFSCFIIEEST